MLQAQLARSQLSRTPNINSDAPKVAVKMMMMLLMMMMLMMMMMMLMMMSMMLSFARPR